MRKFVLILFLMSGAGYAYADTVNLRLVGVSPEAYNDGSAYVYPYKFSINDSTSLVSLFCDDYLDDVNFNESWNAYVYHIDDILAGKGQMNPSGGLVPNDQKTQAYKDAAWLYQALMVNVNQSTAVSINHAVWALFTATPFSANADVTSWVSAANAATSGMTDAQASTAFANVVFYTPVCDPNSTPSCITNPQYGRPQEFIGSITVPEPASLGLLGFGLLALSVARKIRHKAPVPQ